MAISQSTINGISAAFAQPNGSIAITNIAADFQGSEATALGMAANLAALADAGASLIAKANPALAATDQLKGPGPICFQAAGHGRCRLYESHN